MIKMFEDYTNHYYIEKWLNENGIKNYTINKDLTVDVDGNVNIHHRRLTEIPIQFGRIEGSFDCGTNELTSLKGSPNYVSKYFCFSGNKITTLDYLPKYVGDYIMASFNNLKSLKCDKIYVKRLFKCDGNPLPKEILSFPNEDFPDAINIIKYQDEYGIWNDDGSFNKARWEIFTNDYNDGILT